jgi:hypothetical protein
MQGASIIDRVGSFTTEANLKAAIHGKLGTTIEIPLPFLWCSSDFLRLTQVAGLDKPKSLCNFAMMAQRCMISLQNVRCQYRLRYVQRLQYLRSGKSKSAPSTSTPTAEIATTLPDCSDDEARSEEDPQNVGEAEGFPGVVANEEQDFGS